MPIGESDKQHIRAVLKSAWFYVGILLGLAGLLERWLSVHFLIPHWAIIAVVMLFLSLAQFEAYKKRFNEDEPRRILEVNRRIDVERKLTKFKGAEKDVLRAVLYSGGGFRPMGLPDGLDPKSIMPAINKAMQIGLMERTSDGKIIFPHALEASLAFILEVDNRGKAQASSSEGDHAMPSGEARKK